MKNKALLIEFLPKKILSLWCRLFLLIMFASVTVNAQNQTYLYVIPNNPQAYPDVPTGRYSFSLSLNTILSQRGVFQYSQSFPGAKNPNLAKTYEMHLTGSSDTLVSQLVQSGLFQKVEVQEYYTPNFDCTNPVVANNDTYNGSANYALDLIQARCAWSITTGNPNIVIGVVDDGFQTNHPDLAGKFVSVSGGITPTICQHGTKVVGALAANTNNGIGVGAIGRNIKMAGFKVENLYYNASGGSCSGSVFPGLWSAYQAGMKVINISWSQIIGIPPCTPPCTQPTIVDLIKEITENGTTIVLSAGNDNLIKNDNKHSQYANIPGVINVAAVNENDSHEGNTYAQNIWVDLLAPGLRVPTTAETSTYSLGNDTSFAALMVAGTIGLMLSVNPCLSPPEIEEILKATCDVPNDSQSWLDQGRSGSGRLNAYKAVLMAQNYGNYQNLFVNNSIPETIIWDTDKVVNGDLVIPAYKTLIIKSKVKFSDLGKIIVQRAGALIVDKGFLTNNTTCNNSYWLGIEVWGTRGEPQRFRGDYLAGRVEIINGSIVENARNAVRNWKPNDYSKSGGIIFARNSIFRNNRRSVEFIKYINVTVNGIAPDLSNFEGVTFTIDDKYIVPDDFTTHVTMWSVTGVRFSNCLFENISTTKQYDPNLVKNKGIYSIDAGYTLGATCNVTLPFPLPCPANQLDKTIFRGLTYGVHATGTGTINTINVDQCVFEDNVNNVLVEELNNFSVTRSLFKFGNPNISGYSLSKGLFSINSTGYRVEENMFTNSNAIGLIYGLRIVNSGTSNNRIYKNEFSGLTSSSLIFGLNRNFANSFEGFQFLCNTNSNNGLDLGVFEYNSFNNYDGIRIYQGEPSPALSAGNTFSVNGTHISNGTPNPILYYHTGGITTPTNFLGDVIPIQVSNANSCQSNLDIGMQNPLHSTLKTQLQNEYTMDEASFVNVLYNYNNYLMGETPINYYNKCK